VNGSFARAVVLSMASVVAAVVLSYLHKRLRPARAAAVETEADALSKAALGHFADEPGLHDTARRMLRDHARGDGGPELR